MKPDPIPISSPASGVCDCVIYRSPLLPVTTSADGRVGEDGAREAPAAPEDAGEAASCLREVDLDDGPARLRVDVPDHPLVEEEAVADEVLADQLVLVSRLPARRRCHRRAQRDAEVRRGQERDQGPRVDAVAGQSLAVEVVDLGNQFAGAVAQPTVQGTGRLVLEEALSGT